MPFQSHVGSELTKRNHLGLLWQITQKVHKILLTFALLPPSLGVCRLTHMDDYLMDDYFLLVKWQFLRD
jgi:hypothetical protein